MFLFFYKMKGIDSIIKKNIYRHFKIIKKIPKE